MKIIKEFSLFENQSNKLTQEDVTYINDLFWDIAEKHNLQRVMISQHTDANTYYFNLDTSTNIIKLRVTLQNTIVNTSPVFDGSGDTKSYKEIYNDIIKFNDRLSNYYNVSLLHGVDAIKAFNAYGNITICITNI